MTDCSPKTKQLQTTANDTTQQFLEDETARNTPNMEIGSGGEWTAKQQSERSNRKKKVAMKTIESSARLMSSSR